MKLSKELISKATAHARQWYAGLPNGAVLYEQAIRLVQQCNVVAVQNELEETDQVKAHLAGLYLYAGGGKAPFPEEGLTAISGFLQAEQVDGEIISQFREIFFSVLPPQTPMTLAGQVLCDAVNSFWIEEAKGIEVDLPAFVQEALTGKPNLHSLPEARQYLEKLKFFTPAALKMFEKPKKKKLGWFQKGIEHQGEGTGNAEQPGSGLEFLLKESEKPQMARGTETMFRIASREHSELLNLVHQKSGFLASINAIILSIILSVLSTKLNENPHLLIPTILLLITCVATIYYVIMATRPVFINPSNEGFNLETQNIMFFGHFSNMAWKDYRDKLKIITKDDVALFDTFSKNIYYQGIVLKKKYNLLAIGYNIFIGGLIVSILSFVISMVLQSYGAK